MKRNYKLEKVEKEVYDKNCEKFKSSFPKYYGKHIYFSGSNDENSPVGNQLVTTQKLLTDTNKKIDTITFKDPKYTDIIKSSLEIMIQSNKKIETLDNIFPDINDKILIVDFENLNFDVLTKSKNIEKYSEGDRININELQNNIAFILNMMIEESYKKLFIVCKGTYIYDIFNLLFINKGFEYNIILNTGKDDFLRGKVQKVFYYMTETINKIIEGIVDKTLSIDIINSSSEIPHKRVIYDQEPKIKILNSFDDCIIIYLANKAQENKIEYKVISSDLKIFRDFKIESSILLPFYLIRSSLSHKLYCKDYNYKYPIFNESSGRNHITFDFEEYLINSIDDPFFKITLEEQLLLNNEICMLQNEEDNPYNPCKRNPSRNLHTKMIDHYFKPKSKLNHFIKDQYINEKEPKYRGLFNIEINELVKDFSRHGFKNEDEFQEYLLEYYYKYKKYKRKYIQLQNLIANQSKSLERY
jgi:hypothetical protein